MNVILENGLNMVPNRLLLLYSLPQLSLVISTSRSASEAVQGFHADSGPTHTDATGCINA